MISLNWGPVTWFLFHSLAAKIKPEHFNEERNNLILHIKAISNVLPCPICSEHAKQVLKDIDKVKTKEQLQHFLFNFHNSVNTRKKIPLPNISILEQYKTTNLVNIVNTWNAIFKSDTGVIQYMNKNIFRAKTKENFTKYIVSNISKYS